MNSYLKIVRKVKMGIICNSFLKKGIIYNTNTIYCI